MLFWGLSDLRIVPRLVSFEQEKRVSGRLGMPGVNSLDMPITPYQASEEKHSQQPTMPYHPTLTSSSVHHSSHQWTALFLLYYNAT